MADAEPEVFDIFVIGGGINGCGIARDAVGRGYSVCLVEKSDLASGTSSKASKLIHGGFRYLEYYEFRLVREALSEREVLLKSAPHIIWPLRFVLPHHSDMRPAWLLRLGLFLYDHIGKRKLLPVTRSVDLTRAPIGKPLKPLFKKGFEYSDCWVNDARLVVLNAVDARERGAIIETRTECIAARRNGKLWHIKTKDRDTGETKERTARSIVNAAGPWVDKVLGGALGSNKTKNVRLVQGSHIVVPKMFEHDHAYIFQNADERIIFALPYEQHYTLIGTTDRDYHDDPANVKITPEEITYLCEAASEYFEKPVREGDVVWTYSGVRPLYDDGASEAQEATRDYVLRRDGEDAPILNIFGGKITTYRRLAESMMEKVENAIGKKGEPWTVGSTLPGGDFEVEGFDELVSMIGEKYPFLDGQLAWRLARSYGTKAWAILGNAKFPEDLGQDFGDSLYEREVRYLMEEEWAREADDILFRRSKLGITWQEAQKKALQDFMRNSASLLKNVKTA